MENGQKRAKKEEKYHISWPRVRRTPRIRSQGGLRSSQGIEVILYAYFYLLFCYAYV
jgi:hypothetical protein